MGFLCATSVFSVSLWLMNSEQEHTTETQRTQRLHGETEDKRRNRRISWFHRNTWRNSKWSSPEHCFRQVIPATTSRSSSTTDASIYGPASWPCASITRTSPRHTNSPSNMTCHLLCAAAGIVPRVTV